MSSSINDKVFAQNLSLREAYRTMFEFLAAYHERGETDTGSLLGSIQLIQDGGSADPAQLQDFLNAFNKVKKAT